MQLTKYHAKYTALKLTKQRKTNETENMIPILSTADIEIYPHQIEAACFALRSPYARGTILCDDTGLGKSVEACLVMSKIYNERSYLTGDAPGETPKKRILLILPTHLVMQWKHEIDKFDIPAFILDNNRTFEEARISPDDNPFDVDGIVLTTYQFAYAKIDYIKALGWRLACFEEAHRVRKVFSHDSESKQALAIHSALLNVPKLLITATPMQTSIMDLYGLVSFIDDTVFPDAKIFEKNYFRKIEKYPELGERASKLCYRTLRTQVKKFIPITNRVPVTYEFELTPKEEKLYEMIEQYLKAPNKRAFPDMDEYRLTLMLLKYFSSSTFALTGTLENMYNRLKDNDKAAKELEYVDKMLTLCNGITTNAKGKALVQAMDSAFKSLKSMGANRKCVIFTEYKQTQNYIYEALEGSKYKGKSIKFSGDNSRDYEIVDKFKNDYDILISTDIGSEGLNLDFCSLEINYDMPWNILKLEQRIGRCHRKGQKRDVTIINFLNKNNIADIRLMELVNKRMLVFEGVFGISDDVIGNFENDIAKIITKSRSKDEINKAFDELQKKHDKEIKSVNENAAKLLFTTFDEKTLSNIKFTAAEIKQMCMDLEETLWELTKYTLKPFASFNDTDRSIIVSKNPFKKFKLAQMIYKMDKTAAKSQRYGITNPLAKRMIEELELERLYSGSISFESGGTQHKGKRGTIAVYKISVVTPRSMENDIFFIGRYSNGTLIPADIAEEIFNLPVKSCNTGDGYVDPKTKEKFLHECVSEDTRDEMRKLFDNQRQELVDSMLSEYSVFDDDEIEKLTKHTEDMKICLENDVRVMQNDIKRLSGAIENTGDFKARLIAQKEKSLFEKELRQKENALFMEKMKLDAELAKKKQEIRSKQFYHVYDTEVFIIDFSVV